MFSAKDDQDAIRQTEKLVAERKETEKHDIHATLYGSRRYIKTW